MALPKPIVQYPNLHGALTATEGAGNKSIPGSIVDTTTAPGATTERQSDSVSHVSLKPSQQPTVDPSQTSITTRDQSLTETAEPALIRGSNTMSVEQAPPGSPVCGKRKCRPTAQTVSVHGDGQDATPYKDQKEEGELVRADVPSHPTDTLATFDPHDDYCKLCGEGGKLICCEYCPTVCHLRCAGLARVPDEGWFCFSCRCQICDKSNYHLGTDLGCSEETIIYCDQCEREYHVGCIRRQGTRLDSIPSGDWFCGKGCELINKQILARVGTWQKLKKNIYWSIFKRGSSSYKNNLNTALEIFEESFHPIVNQRTWENQAEMMVHSRSSVENDFRGFMTIILRVGKVYTTAATIRIFGDSFAEMPLIATRFTHRNKGLCKTLMNILEEDVLRPLGVKALTIPSMEAIVDMWKDKYNFREPSLEERRQMHRFNIFTLTGTTRLVKVLTSTATPSAASTSKSKLNSSEMTKDPSEAIPSKSRSSKQGSACRKSGNIAVEHGSRPVLSQHADPQDENGCIPAGSRQEPEKQDEISKMEVDCMAKFIAIGGRVTFPDPIETAPVDAEKSWLLFHRSVKDLRDRLEKYPSSSTRSPQPLNDMAPDNG
eukprot:scaffold478_cov409-Prasinococcus_capsulatus_cf.AAC.18